MNRRSLAERLWEKVDVRSQDECWPWQACVDDHGYGVINAGGRGKACKAHRIVAELSGIETEGVIIRHTCDNPPCCNPRHLLPGTQADNLRDMHMRGRSGVTGSRCHLAKLDEAAVAEIRRLSREGTNNTQLAKQFGVTRTNIVHIVHRRSWKHVD